LTVSKNPAAGDAVCFWKKPQRITERFLCITMASRQGKNEAANSIVVVIGHGLLLDVR
jgi:hypothetical protein